MKKVKELDRMGENIFMGTLGAFLNEKNKYKYKETSGLFLLWEYLKSVDEQKPYLKILQNRQSIVGALYFLSTSKYLPSNRLSKEKHEELQKTAKEYLEYNSDMFFKKIQSNFNESYEVDDNIVKTVTSELNITQRELAEIIKVNEVTVRQWSSKGEIKPNTEVTLNLLLENHQLKSQLEGLKNFASLLKSLE